MDKTALYNLTYGLYIIGTLDGKRNAGCVVNTVTQSTSEPLTLTVCIHKDNYTNICIKKTKAFAVSILSEKTKESTFGVFGFNSSRDNDKFSKVPFNLTPSGLPYISEGITGYLQCEVIDFIDNFTHTIFIAKIQEAENLFKEYPMTYAYYHSVIKGKTPKNAPSYAKEEIKENLRDAYVCEVCGYIYPKSKEEFKLLPDSYLCPVCGAPKSKFSLQPVKNS